MSEQSVRPGRTSGAVVMVDVAREAGVSQKTVSRVVNGSDQVSPDLRDRVMAAIDTLGYRRNSAARALAAGRTHLIGIVAMGSPLFGIAQHVVGVERAARERGYGTVVVATGEDGDADVGEARAGIERALALGAEGLVLVEPFWGSPEVTGQFSDVPVVFPLHTDHPSPELPALHGHVTAADREGGRRAVQHLADLGHRRIAHISGPDSWRPALLREQGWREVLAEHDGEAGEPLRGDWSARSGYAAAQELLRRGEPFTALFAANDAMAIGAVRALSEAGLRVPDDVAVVGYDDLPESEFQLVPLTTVRQDFAALSRLAVGHIADALEGRQLAGHPVTVPTRLVVRASSGGPRRGGAPPA